MDCSTLSVLFPESVYFRGSAEYTATTTSYFGAFENELVPACIVRPRSAAELGKIVKHLSSLPDVPQVAIKGGGHTAWAGAANIDKGVLIDMQLFKETTVHDNSVSIGAGERWGNVYEKLGSRGLAVAGGRVSKVGVGGLILGGGLSLFSETRGFVCDQVTNFEVVIASGEVVQANTHQNPDLFKALKGGNNNFGIVTQFSLPVFEQARMWGGLIFHSASAWPAVVDNYIAWSEAPDKYGTLIIARVYSAAMEGVSVCVYSSSTTEISPAFKNLSTIQPPLFSTVREDSLLGLTQEQSNFSHDGDRQLFFTSSFRNAAKVMLEAEKLFEARVESLKTMIPGFVLSLTLQPLTKQMLIESARHGNSLGLLPDDGPLVIVLLNSVHQNKEDDGKVVEGVQNLLREIEELSREEGVAAKYRFMNYAYKGTPVFEGYGRESVEELKAVSRKYDPEQFFQKAVPGGYKISSVET